MNALRFECRLRYKHMMQNNTSLNVVGYWINTNTITRHDLDQFVENDTIIL